MAFTRLYLLNQAAPYTPATIRGAWDDTASAVTKAMDTVKEAGGSVALVSAAETSTTDPWDVLLYRGVSGPLAAQTLSGTINIMMAVLQTSGSANMHYHIHLYVTQGDSDTPRGTLITDYTEAAGVNEWSATFRTGRALNAAQSLSSLAISEGDRLVFEMGYAARNVSATSFTGSTNYGTVQDGTTAVALENGSRCLDGIAGVRFDTTTGVRYASFLDFSNAIEPSVAYTVRESAQTVLTLTTEPKQINLSALTLLSLVVVPQEEEAVFTSDVQGLCWVEIYHCDEQGDDQVFVHAQVDLNDPSTYYGGYKSPRVLAWGDVVRALSDERGEYESSEFTWIESDTDRLIRGWFT